MKHDEHSSSDLHTDQRAIAAPSHHWHARSNQQLETEVIQHLQEENYRLTRSNLTLRAFQLTLSEAFEHLQSNLRDLQSTNDLLQSSCTQQRLMLASLAAEKQEVARLERQRLARELHDSVSQELYCISLDAHSACEALIPDSTEALDLLQQIIAHTEAGLSEMRAIFFELRPELLEAEGLVAVLKQQITVLEQRRKLTIALFAEDEPDLPLKSKIALYRIAREALHNVVKHAHASSVKIWLLPTATEIVFIVRDNGCGFDAAMQYTQRLGLHSIQERIASLHGTMKIESYPGAGTTLSVYLPV